MQHFSQDTQVVICKLPTKPGQVQTTTFTWLAQEVMDKIWLHLGALNHGY